MNRSDDSIVVQPKRQAPPPAVAAQAAVAPPPSKIAKTKTPKKAAITKVSVVFIQEKRDIESPLRTRVYVGLTALMNHATYIKSVMKRN